MRGWMPSPFKETTRELWTGNIQLLRLNLKPSGINRETSWISWGCGLDITDAQQSTCTYADGPYSPNHLRTLWTFSKCLQLCWSQFEHALKQFVELGGNDESGPQWVLWKCMMYLNLTYLCSKLSNFSTESNWKMNNT